MRDFNRSSGPRRSFDNRGGSGRGTEERQTFKAVCADCGRDCDLPFEPRGNRPVYCRDCFRNHPQEDRPQRFDSRDSRGGGDRRGSSDSRSDSRGGSSERQMFSAVCSNCGKTCQLPFEPRSDKPVFCSRCFEDKEKGVDMSQRRSNSNGTSANSEMAAINAKLDKILNLLGNSKAVKKAEGSEKSQRIENSGQIQQKTSFESAVEAENIEKSLKEVKAEKVEKVSKPKKTVKKVAPVEVIEAAAPIETPVEAAAETPTE